MAIISNGVSNRSSLRFAHRLFYSESLCGWGRPTLTPGTGTITCEKSDIGTNAVLTLAGVNASMFFPCNQDIMGQSGELGTVPNDTSAIVLLTVDDDGADWNTASDRLTLFSLNVNDTNVVMSLQVRRLTNGTTTLRAFADSSEYGNLSTAFDDLLLTRTAILVERSMATSETNGRVSVWAADATSAPPIITAQWIKDNGSQYVNGTLAYVNGASGRDEEVGAFELYCSASALGTGVSPRVQFEGVAVRTDGEDAFLDTQVGLGALVGADWGASGGTGVFVHCPPGRWDTTATAVWAETEVRNAGGGGPTILRTKLELSSTFDYAAAFRTTALANGNYEVRVNFYDGDPGASGVLLGSGPWMSLDLRSKSNYRLGTAFCAGHNGLQGPLYGFETLESCDAINFGDDWGYPTGNQSGTGGSGICTSVDDFVQAQLMLWLDPFVAKCLRSVPIWIQPGDHNFGIDAIQVEDHDSGTAEGQKVKTRWDGTTTAQHHAIIDNAQSVWHRFVTSGMPNVQGFTTDPATSGYDYYARLPNGDLIYALESVAYRGLVTDSLASDSVDTYPTSGRDQEADFETVTDLFPDSRVYLCTVRAEGPAQLTFVDNWFEGKINGMNRLVTAFGGKELILLTGDRHLFEINKAPSFPGVLAEITAGAMAATQFSDPTDTTGWTTGRDADTIFSFLPTGITTTGSGEMCRAFGIVSVGNGTFVEAYQILDDGTIERVGRATIVKGRSAGRAARLLKMGED